MPRYTKTERVGINAVERIVVDDLGWIFHPMTTVDVGIDAQVELVDPEPTGQLIALQIKTGPGNFKEQRDRYVYYGSLAHLEYWLGYSMPVVLVGHFPAAHKTVWAPVRHSTVSRTAKRCRIALPKSLIFGNESRAALNYLFYGLPKVMRPARDFLTGLHDRITLRERLTHEIDSGLVPMCVVYADLDHLKAINDQYGHMIGDEVLFQAARLFESAINEHSGWLVRYGGDEFLVVLPKTPLSRAIEIAERIRGSFMAAAIVTSAGQVMITVSLGVAELRPGLQTFSDQDHLADALVRSADEATYRAKDAGRNRVYVAE